MIVGLGGGGILGILGALGLVVVVVDDLQIVVAWWILCPPQEIKQ